MSAALQIALFVVAVAVALFVLLMIPLTILLYRRAIGFSRQLEALNTEVIGLVQDSRTMVQNISAVTSHVNEQLDELDRIVRIITRWSERVDHVVEEVGTTIELPFVRVKQSIKAFFQGWRFIKRLAGHALQQTDRKNRTNTTTEK
ncbi:MAG TPA: DUF948 domain-containing protein [Candidatus Sulfotelmatobacter sp.]|nr:DUF948 domain-containing protein [Candidatus Sulfotelmatobacter sp.]